MSGHLSRRAEATTGRRDALRPTWTSPSRVDGPAWPCTGRGLPGRRVTTTPVRSYRTFSPLPVRDSRVAAPSAVCFCGTFPRLSPGGRYPPPCPLVSGLSSRGCLSPRVRSARLSDVRPKRAHCKPARISVLGQASCSRNSIALASPPSLRPPPCLVFAGLRDPLRPYTARKTPTTLPSTWASVVMIGSISSFSGWRRMWSGSRK